MESTITISELLSLLEKYSLKPNKKLGQNFLIDENIVRKIINLAEVDQKEVLEIGAGPGTLTTFLSQKAKKVFAVEIDKKILNVLKEVCQNLSNVEIINQDFLKLNVKNLTSTQKLCVVGNLPYYVTSQILFKLFEERNYIESFTIMVQKEVAQRLLAKPGSKDYGILTVAMNFYCKVEDYFHVSKNVFYPRPEVDSTVLKVTFKEDIPDVDEKKFFKIVHACFSTRRKTILNSLSNSLGIEKAELKHVLEKAFLQENLRAEDLSLDHFVRLYKELKNII
ncbi:16S rRNA (adenine(1518)-N(6)/adenine(1519)-N(6))-dimethyltransferase RsmA [Caldicellulosiruptor naganoensis]|uniref:Ribosomal RNA small subunit methyltransferase A n=1 Tax=Caldicellulosiruptor naganoensis TaxID=29324 RepID=A0ABY7BIG5_9FIRM|nr:16S rRNA (adenine(1518)-N(6)/adenine(1519)-N(6))-dimethyltransferase RsmA [Caldicellulosiruptor naganoensis]WAM31371.1 16S rRNA (adenine(1518)-N(6)/adenine(1519)-N(6))-dimethyltransferase RsmA [Caldicellulosiruptor naganoensis]